MSIKPADFEYLWPRAILLPELSALASADYLRRRGAQLFAEAFGPRALRVVEDLHSDDEVRQLVLEVLDNFNILPSVGNHGPYFAERSGDGIGERLNVLTLSISFHTYVDNLSHVGYFEEAIPDSSQSTIHLDLFLQRRLGFGATLWTGFRGNFEAMWEAPLLLSIIEVLDEAISRPRLTMLGGDPPRFRDFSQETGQALFRAWVNMQLSHSYLDNYRMATEGIDAGKIVLADSTEQGEYLEEQAAADHNGAEDDVRHAIALFRDRNRTRATKRSAVETLVHVLEERRPLIKSEFLKRDEADLFEIANRFAIRHNRSDQQPDYADEYLDWLFWWYLATIELTDRLIERGG